MNDIRVKDVMTNLVVFLYPEDSIQEAARRLSQNRISGAPVVKEGKLVGVISESDLLRAAAPPASIDRGLSTLDFLGILSRLRVPHDGHRPSVEDAMTRSVFRISPDASLWDAAAILERYGIKRLPVVDEDGFVLGIISRADVVRAVARTDQQMQIDAVQAADLLGRENFEDLHVEVNQGVATLGGLTDRRSTKELLVKLVRRIPGVIEVRDRLDFGFDDVKDARAHLSSTIVGRAV